MGTGTRGWGQKNNRERRHSQGAAGPPGPAPGLLPAGLPSRPDPGPSQGGHSLLPCQLQGPLRAGRSSSCPQSLGVQWPRGCGGQLGLLPHPHPQIGPPGPSATWRWGLASHLEAARRAATPGQGAPPLRPPWGWGRPGSSSAWSLDPACSERKGLASARQHLLREASWTCRCTAWGPRLGPAGGSP